MITGRDKGEGGGAIATPIEGVRGPACPPPPCSTSDGSSVITCVCQRQKSLFRRHVPKMDAGGQLQFLRNGSQHLVG
ncbi:hypothetical protein CDAR_95781 [Caerostris darwini]|uniref:Uncharacterized protein n=1 Tax=Caerostris darwini TaxID=1538125 RepID=A0AAV4UQ89_9ARAC|nr:hypothetical protein CDAR_95781 [Caerostris darwini]